MDRDSESGYVIDADADEFETLDGADFDDDENTIGDPPPVREPPRTLGDAGTDNTDESYSGEVSTAPLSMDYFRAKFLEFQTTLNSLDVAYRAAQSTLAIPGLPSDISVGLQNSIQEYEDRRVTLRRTAETLNAGAALANSAGLRMPVLSLPQTLGVPFLVPIAIAGGVTAAVSLVMWGNRLIEVIRTYVLRAQAYAQLAPDARVKLAEELTKIDAARDASGNTGLSAIAGSVKWIAIAAIAYFAWKSFQDTRERD